MMVVEELSMWLDNHFSFGFLMAQLSDVNYCGAPVDAWDDAWELEPTSSSLPITITNPHF